LLLADVPTLGWGGVLVRLSVAAALGGAIGLERELREHQAGLRTHLLVSVGSAVFTIVSAYGFNDFLTHGGTLVRTDPTRIAAQIVTGIGFLGAGAILRQGLSIRGLTTAASLWLVAGIGMASGAGYYSAAVIATAGALLTLEPLRYASRPLLGRFRAETDRVLVQVPTGGSPSPLIDAIEGNGGRVVALEVSEESDRRNIAIDVQIQPGSAVEVAAGLAEVEGVLEVRWSE
jgi:putative Mg2+ transporter-C (MgtC) family protein